MKKIIFTLLICFMCIPNVFAGVTTYDRQNYANYGINKKWDVTTSNLQNILKTPLVDANEKVYDFSDILTDEEEEQLREEINLFIKKYDTELIIVTKSVSYVNDSTNDVFASDFYDYNDFGINFNKYNGILLFRNTFENDPYYDFYMFGDSQLYFDYTDRNTLLDGIYSDLHSHNYKAGFSSFIDYVNYYYERGVPEELQDYFVDDDGYLHKIKPPYTVPYAVIVVISSIVALIFTSINVSKNKMIRKETKASQYLNQKSVNYKVKEDKFIRKHITHYTESSSSSSGGGGGYSSSSGSSGGGFSSGGGRHG